MSKKIEDLLGINFDDDDDAEEMSSERDTTSSGEVDLVSELSSAEKIEMVLSSVDNMSDHDVDMDDIAKKALEAYGDLVDIGSNATDMYAGKIYEVAAQMLNAAISAKNAKANRKLKMIDLQLKKFRIDKIADLSNKKTEEDDDNVLDRNYLLKLIQESNNQKNTDGEK